MALHSFSLAKTCGIIGYGAFFWGLGVLSIRHCGTCMFQTNLSRSLTMTAIVPAAYTVIRLTEAVFSLNVQDTLAAVALGIGAASILDGIAYTWFPSAYECPELQKKDPLAACTISRYGSGSSLFFVGAALTMLVFM
ncbi:unnamed protein product [Rotaria sp. Silwood1]|nr:unnamed protein product [Rotaria sp. Silwood1]CAF1687476.1 unnamed protein product [Rotaria sp. Silwood1]